MKRTVLRYTSIFLTMLLLLPMWTGVFASAAGEPGIVASGYCGMPENWNHTDPFSIGDLGHNLTWTLDADGTLTVSGTGEMADFSDCKWLVDESFDEDPTIHYCNPPWDSNAIQKVVISEGVTSIGAGAFKDCRNIVEVKTCEELEEIKSYINNFNVVSQNSLPPKLSKFVN